MATYLGSVAVSAVAALTAVLYALVGVRARRCDPGSAPSFFAVAAVALVIGALLLGGFVSSIVGFVLLCLTLVGFQLFDLMQDERARRRRVASLVPRPAAEAIPAVWVGIAVASVTLLVPYAIAGEQRAAALTVGACAAVMAAIAWRIASAPAQLRGEDIRYERLRDRALRSRKAGLSAVLATGSIYAFICFVNAGLPALLPLQRTLLLVSLFTWAGLLAWVLVYSSRLERLSASASAP